MMHSIAVITIVTSCIISSSALLSVYEFYYDHYHAHDSLQGTRYTVNLSDGSWLTLKKSAITENVACTLPSGNLDNYGKSPLLLGKLTINGHISIAPEGTSNCRKLVALASRPAGLSNARALPLSSASPMKSCFEKKTGPGPDHG